MRIKVAAPQLLAKLRAQLLQPETVGYITEQLRQAVAEATTSPPEREAALRKQLGDERRKRDNLVGAIEDGGDDLSAFLSALKAREATIRRLEGELVSLARAPSDDAALQDLPEWVQQQLQDLHGLLKEDVTRVKAEFRRLNLALTFAPVDLESDHHYFHINGQCDLSALAFSFLQRAERRAGAGLDRSLEGSVQKRTLTWVFERAIPGNGKTGRWRERRARLGPSRDPNPKPSLCGFCRVRFRAMEDRTVAGTEGGSNR